MQFTIENWEIVYSGMLKNYKPLEYWALSFTKLIVKNCYRETHKRANTTTGIFVFHTVKIHTVI